MILDLRLNILVWLLVPLLTVVGGSPWYRGCYHGNVTPNPPGGAVSSRSPAECAAVCNIQGIPYAAIYGGQSCQCTSLIPENISNDCISCRRFPRLLCGGNDSHAVYEANGPYILNASLHIGGDRPLLVHEDVPIRISVTYAGQLNATIGLPDTILDDDVQLLNLTVTTEGQTINRSLKAKDVYNDMLTFERKGNYTIELRAANDVSTISTTVYVSVQHPVPAELQVTMETARASRPSCVPQNATTSENVTTHRVFANETARFEASVSAGYNMTFDWSFGDGDNMTDEPFLTGCEERHCRSSETNHTYRNEGKYKMHVIGHNEHGTVNNSIELIVVNRVITNLTLDVEDSVDNDRFIKAISPHDSIQFLISVYTTDRQDTYLEMDLGDSDGPIKKYLLVDKSGEYLGRRDGDPGHISLLADYGSKGCILKLAWKHTFRKEGFFIARAHVYNNNSDLDIVLNKPVAVLSDLQGLTVHGNRNPVVGSHYEYMAEFTAGQNVTYNWTVISPAEEVIYNVAGSGNKLRYAFNEKGVFKIELKTFNPVSSEDDQFSVHVHENIGNVTLELTGKQFVKRGEPVSLRATAESDKVYFEWEFNGPGTPVLIQEYNGTSVAEYTYQQAGNYTVEVNVSTYYENKVVRYDRKIEVLDPIETLKVSTTSPTLAGNITAITAEANGSNVKFELKYDNITYPRYVYGTTRTTFNVVFRLGETRVTVIAMNAVSEVQQVVVVEVEEGVDRLTLTSGVDPVQGEKVVFESRLGEKTILSDRKDLWYIWSLDSEIKAYITVPVFEYEFPKQEDNSKMSASLTVEVKNRVCDVCPVDSQKFRIRRYSDKLRFIQGAVWEYPYPVHFSIVNLPAGCKSVLVKHVEDEAFRQVESNLTSGMTPFTWSHNYSAPGVYLVEANVHEDDSSQSTRIAITVQERIKEAKLTGPRAVPVHELSPKYEWNVTAVKGSHMLYEWAIDGKHVRRTPKPKLRWRFKKAGDYNISVRVSNSLGAENISSVVLAEYAIHKIELEALPVFLDDQVLINFTVYGGPMRKATFDFGDGNITDLDEDAAGLRKEQIGGIATGQHGPTTRYFLNYHYKTVGSFNLVVNVSNFVSWKLNRRNATVEEPINGINVSSDANPVVERGSRIVVKATVSSGQNLMFDWHISNDIIPESESNNQSSTISFALNDLGVYNVTVFVSTSRLQFSDFKTASLPYLFRVQERVAHLNVGPTTKWAGLVKDKRGLWRTKAVNFTARVNKGSDVTFHFNYGDGGSNTVEGVRSDTAESARSSHIYREEGNYTVNVSAVNLLGSVSTHFQFFVQTPPSGCALSSGRFYVQLGSYITINASHSSGSGVKFDWNMGDNTEYKDSESSIKHLYEAEGTYRVDVDCYNKVETKKSNATVEVVSPISTVIVEVEGGTFHTNSKDVIFKAIITPSTLNGGSIKYVWNFGEPSRWDKGRATMSKIYKKPGRYHVQARALNAVSNKTSNVVLVDIIEPVKALELSLIGEPLIHRKLTFKVYHYAGTNVTYHWDFGDGTKKQRLTQYVEHSYDVTGQYSVTVTARNRFGNQSDTLSVFILHKPCSAPQVDLLIPPQSYLSVTRSQDFKLETEVTINCSITSAANYTWTLWNATTLEPVHLPDVPQDVFHDPILYIPRRALSYGNYSVELKVVMQGTIVYTPKQTYFLVIPSSLISIINGGIRRRVQRNESIVMDGSGSYDPDYPNATDIRYSWKCYQLNTMAPCFNDGTSLDLNFTSKILTLNGTSFNDSVDSKFVFNMTITRPGRLRVYTTQVLDIARTGVIDMKVSCSECEYGYVNSDQRLILEAIHPGFQESELEYEWRLFLVEDGGNTPSAAQVHDDLNCVAADGSSYLALKLPKNDTDTEKRNVSHGRKNEGGDQSSTSSTTSDARTVAGSTRSSTTTTPENSDIGPGPEFQLQEGLGQAGGRAPDANPAGPAGSPSDEPIPMKEGSAPGQLDVTAQEGPSGGRSSSGSPSGWHGSDPPASPGNNSPGTPLHTSDGPSEGRGKPRGSGSGSGRDSGHSSGGSGQNHENAGSIGGGGQDVSDTDRGQLPIDIHTVSKGRFQTWIKATETTTGLHQRALVIKKDVLKQGRTYIIEGLIKHRVTGKEGTASAYVRINESPSLGQCFWRLVNPPKSGTEIETSFTIMCSDWTDDDKPIQYEISYSLDNGTSRDLIYQGLNHQTTFKLPAGSPKLNNTVQVNIAILDKYGARTTVCSLPVKVLPKAVGDPKAEEEDLLNLVEQENSTLQTYVSKGDNRNARLHTQLVAHRLNRLHKNTNDSDNSIRAKIRTTLLHTLKDLPMRDEYEVQQTTSAVAASTAITDELCEKSLEYASEILVKATERVTQISDVTKHVDRDIISLAIVGSSNVVAAASELRVVGERTKPVVERTRWSIHNLTQAELNFTVLGEEPLKRETEHLSTYAGRFKTNQIPNITTRAANFTLPESLNNNLVKQITTKRGGSHGNQTRDCYEMHVVTYKQNPFLYGEGRKQQVQSQVASLALFACGGPELTIKDLPPSDQVVMTIPHLPEKVNDELPTYVLHKHQMMVHQINVSLDPTDQRSTYMLIELEPVSQGRLFPIALMLRPKYEPNPTQYQYRKVFAANAEKLTISLPPLSLNESTTYYLGVVDANFNADRPRPGEVRERRYTLRIWKGECVFWDEQKDAWSNKGCLTSLTSTYSTTSCKCNHLTAFGTQLSLVPNDLKINRNVEDFFDLNENPVTVILVICTFALYFILLVLSVMADKHDEKKGAIVHLLDNSTLHKHAYVITLETGMRRSAGTTAKVSFVLHGEEGMSETRELVSELGQPLFERNSRDTFIMTLPESLGHIWKVQIWHNNAGPSPDWYLSRVIVNDIQKSKVFYFSCEKWFAVEEEDGKVEREIMSLEYGLGFAKVLWAKGTQYLTDYHLWFSMLARPSYSRFTRAQRLTCCLSLIFSYMAVNAAWYRQKVPEYRGEVGLIDLSWRAVAVGAITSLMVLPVNLLLVLIFRRSKIKKVCIEDPPEKYFGGKRDSATSLDSTVRLLQPAVTPSIFDQSMINWTSLQDWAQRQWTKRYQQEGTNGGQNSHKHGADPKTFSSKHGVQDCETDQTSSGIEDCIVHERTVEHIEMGPQPPHQKTSLSSTAGEKESSYIEQLSRNNSKRLSQDSQLRWQQELDRYVLDAIRSRKSKRCFLPHWCRYIAWTVAIVIIIGCAAITLLYGFRFGKAKSIAWLQSLFFSFIQCVFITHPVVVLVISVYTAIKYRNDLSIFDHHDDGIIEQRTNAMIKARQPKQEENNDDDLAKGIAERQRSRYLRCARPPQEKQLIEARKKIMKEKKATSLLSDSVGAALLLFLLIFVAYPKDNTTPYRLNSVLKDILTKSGNQHFDSIQRIDEWYRWSQTYLLDTLYWETWYNGQPTQHKNRLVGNSDIIGSVSLRQLRVSPEKCLTPDPYHVIKVCRPHYHYDSHDVRPFGINGTWRFNDTSMTRATGFTGKHAHYDGTGYQLILPNTRKDAYDMMKSLETGKWIDRSSRGVVIEFTLFNAPTNIFTSVSLLLEIPPSGAPSTMSRVKSVYLFKYITEFDNFVLACELLLMVVTLYKLHCEIGELAWLKKDYIKNPWNTIEAAIIVLLLAYIACYLYRFVLVHEVVEVLRATYHEKFVDISYVAYWDEILRSFLGFIILLTLVKSLRLLRNRKVFSKFGGVYRKAGMELLCLACIMGIWLCAYTCLGYALYGAVSYNFSRVDLALTTVVSLMTGEYGLKEAEMTDRIGSQIFLISFLILAVGSLTAYIVAVLTFHYRIYRDEGLPSLTTPEAFRYFWNEVFQLAGFLKNPPEEAEAQETKLPAEFTMAEIENQVDEMLFKMNALTGASGLPVKAPDYITSDSDCTYGTGDDGISSGGSEVRPFDEVRFEYRLNKIEDNLMNMGNEAYLAQLLKLDSIGANVLSQEKENQLRSALEFEIFRQLQMQRGNNPEVQSLPSDNGQVIFHRLSSLSSSSSTGSQGSSSYGTPVTMPTSVRKSREHLHKTRTEQDVLSLRSIKSKDSTHSARTPTRGSRQSLSMSDGIRLQNLSEGASSAVEDAIPLQDLVAALMSPSKAEGDSENALCSAVETRLLEDPVSTSSCSSGGAEIRSIVTQNHPKSHTGHSLSEAAMIKGGAKPKHKSLAILDKQLSFEHLYPDTSSGSERDAALRSSSKARSLRKTKSRGKGKGRGRLTLGEGIDELGLDNQGYTSESDHESRDGTLKSRQKQSWN